MIKQKQVFFKVLSDDYQTTWTQLIFLNLQFSYRHPAVASPQEKWLVKCSHMCHAKHNVEYIILNYYCYYYYYWRATGGIRPQKCFSEEGIRHGRGAWVGQQVTQLPLAQDMIPGSCDRVLHRAPCSEGNMLLPFPLLLLFLYVCQINQ